VWFSCASDIHDLWAAVGAIRRQIAYRPVDGVLLDVRRLDYLPSCAESRSLATELARSLGRRRLALVTDSGVVASAMAQTLALQASACSVNVDVFHGESAALTWLDDPDAL
jgi:hypothetical protein